METLISICAQNTVAFLHHFVSSIFLVSSLCIWLYNCDLVFTLTENKVRGEFYSPNFLVFLIDFKVLHKTIIKQEFKKSNAPKVSEVLSRRERCLLSKDFISCCYN